MNIPRKFSPVTAAFAAVAVTVVVTLSGCGGTNNTSAQTPSGATAASSPSDTDPIAPAVDRVKAELLPEEGQIDSIERRTESTAVCAEGYDPQELTLGGTVTFDKASVKTNVTGSKVVITADGKLLSVESLIVNGTKATPLTPDVAQATNTQLTLRTGKWGVGRITSLVFCLGGSGLRAPVLND